MDNQNEKSSQDGGILKTAAAAIGGAAGKIAALAKGTVQTEKKPASESTARDEKTGRFPKKNKLRLPRKEKKELGKKAGGVIA